MTIDARTAPPEPSLHAATLLSRTRLTQVEVAARLGISERMLRYHVAGRPMPYALRVTFERLALELEMAYRLVDAFREQYPEITEYGTRITGGTVDAAKFAEGFDLPGPELHFLNTTSFKDALPEGGGRRLMIRDLLKGTPPLAQMVACDYSEAELRTHAALAEGQVRAFNFAEAEKRMNAAAAPLLTNHDPAARLTDEESEALRRSMSVQPAWMGIDRGASDDVYEPRMVRCPNPACNEAYSPILDACPACAHPNARPSRYRK